MAGSIVTFISGYGRRPHKQCSRGKGQRSDENPAIARQVIIKGSSNLAMERLPALLQKKSPGTVIVDNRRETHWKGAVATFEISRYFHKRCWY